MSFCVHCRQAIRQTLRQNFPVQRHAQLSTKADTAHKILAKPSWSVRSLVSSDNSTPPTETITPKQLHHLLKLSALPLPKSKAEEESMISTLQSQLHFVRAIQRVDTTGVEPLQAIRDETEAGRKEATINLEDLKGILNKETFVGHYKRPRRVKEKLESAAEQWDPLSTASRKAGKYFVVEAAKKEGEQ